MLLAGLLHPSRRGATEDHAAPLGPTINNINYIVYDLFHIEAKSAPQMGRDNSDSTPTAVGPQSELSRS